MILRKISSSRQWNRLYHQRAIFCEITLSLSDSDWALAGVFFRPSLPPFFSFRTFDRGRGRTSYTVG